VPPEPQPAQKCALPLRFEGVCLEVRGQQLLHDLSFTLRAGSISAILGPNGAGKSLALRLANGLIAPSAGRIHWQGGAARARAACALVFQQPVLLRRSARANLDYALRMRGVPAAERARRAARALARVRLDALSARPAHSFSGGEQQRLALARAWALAPEVLFLDEPAAALDPDSSRALEAAVREMHAEGAKIVLTTHDLSQAKRMADEVLFMQGGRLREQTSAREFFAEPRSAAARNFLRAEGAL